MEKEIDSRYITYTVSSDEEFVKAQNIIINNIENDKVYFIRKKEVDNKLLKELPYEYNNKTKDFELSVIIYEVYNEEDFVKAKNIIKKTKFNNKTFTIRKKRDINDSITFFYNYNSNRNLNIIIEIWKNSDGNTVKQVEYTPEMKEISCYEFEYHPDGTEKLWRLLDEDRNILEEEEADL